MLSTTLAVSLYVQAGKCSQAQLFQEEYGGGIQQGSAVLSQEEGLPIFSFLQHSMHVTRRPAGSPFQPLVHTIPYPTEKRTNFVQTMSSSARDGELEIGCFWNTGSGGRSQDSREVEGKEKE